MSIKSKAIYAATPRTQRGLPVVLGGDPKGKNFLYANGNSVIIRDIATPSICDVYTEHSATVNCAKYSPSGFYIASADNAGKVRIWDTTQKEHILKNEYQPFGGPIRDLAWSPDSQRIVVGGEGRERFGHVFMADTGTSVGEIAGQSKPINCVDFRPGRPFRVITASEDCSVGFFQGPPFKFDKTLNDHNNFVNCVRYSPNGERFASGGADGKVVVYEGKDGNKLLEMGGDSKAHQGGVYGVCFSPDNAKLISASGDRSVKLWDITSGNVVQEFRFGDDLESMQLGCLWQGQYILSVSLAGFVTYLDINDARKPIRVIKGHNKSVTALAVDKRSQPCEMFTGSHDGSITYWKSDSGENERVAGKGHSNQIQGLAITAASGSGDADGVLNSCAIDDVLKQAPLSQRAFSNNDLKLPSMPRDLTALSMEGLVGVACAKHVLLVKDGQVLSTLDVGYEPASVALRPDSQEVAIGGTSDNKLHIYAVEGGRIAAEKESLTHGGAVTALAYSSDGQYLVAGDAYRKVTVYSTQSKYERKHQNEWGFHTARVDCVAWSPDDRFVVSGSLDTSIIVWYMDDPQKHVILRGAHPMSQVNKVAWLDKNTIVSVGHDGHVKLWHFAP